MKNHKDLSLLLCTRFHQQIQTRVWKMIFACMMVSLACDFFWCGDADVEDETGLSVMLMTMMPATLPDCEYFGMEIVEMEIVGRDLTNWTSLSISLFLASFRKQG